MSLIRQERINRHRMWRGKAVEVKEIRSDEELREAQNHELVLVDFGTPWSAACRMQESIVRKLALQLENRVCVAVVNVDQITVVASQLRIQNIPTLVIFHKGRECKGLWGCSLRTSC
jgi:thioredoxin-like negative regulator of GroEL